MSTKGAAFDQHVVEAMSRINERPIIFALSNPTSKVECTAEQVYAWSKGKALYAAGVQFPDVTLGGKVFHPGQANNFYVYPQSPWRPMLRGRGVSPMNASSLRHGRPPIKWIRVWGRRVCSSQAKRIFSRPK